MDSRFFAGDDRTFSVGSASHRSEQWIGVNVDPVKYPDGKVIEPVYHFGQTEEYCRENLRETNTYCDWDKSGAPIATATAEINEETIKIDVTRVSNSQLHVHFEVHASDPLLFKAPAIDGCFDLEISQPSPSAPVSYLLNGYHNAYPAHEIYLNDEPLHQFNPDVPPTHGPLELFGGCGPDGNIHAYKTGDLQ